MTIQSIIERYRIGPEIAHLSADRKPFSEQDPWKDSIPIAKLFVELFEKFLANANEKHLDKSALEIVLKRYGLIVRKRADEEIVTKTEFRPVFGIAKSAATTIVNVRGVTQPPYDPSKEN